jgi:transposase
LKPESTRAVHGHEVRLIAPVYVKPFVKRQKNDMADAEAVCEAAQRPTMRFVAVKRRRSRRQRRPSRRATFWFANGATRSTPRVAIWRSSA